MIQLPPGARGLSSGQIHPLDESRVQLSKEA